MKSKLSFPKSIVFTLKIKQIQPYRVLSCRGQLVTLPGYDKAECIVRRIFLIGFMGSGKSFTGKQLSRLLEIPFIDLDDYIEEQAGKSIKQIFETEGEHAFRDRERRALHDMIQYERAVIACGGGTPCFGDNMAWMNRNGLTVYLKAPVDLLARRLEPETAHRPLLKGLDADELRRFIRQRLRRRAPYYEQAGVVYEQENGLESIAAELVRHLEDIIGH